MANKPTGTKTTKRPRSGSGGSRSKGIDKQLLQDLRGQVEAIKKSQAVIEFNLDGTIINANDNFLSVVGYTLDEIKGQHHSMFVEPEYKVSPEYRQFWEALNRGEYRADEFKRIGKGGKEVWIQASYNPIFDTNGKPFKVVKYATDVTEQKLQNADYQGQIEGISKSQAVIQFNLDGTIITANDNFLSVLGYTLDEIKGQHHSMFVEPEYKASPEYKMFWESLNRGQDQTGQFKRIGKGGKEVWIQASYTPIPDLSGNPFKVVKYATDITEQTLRNADYEGKIKGIERTQAVIEFNLDGTIITANDNFLATLGYTLAEIKGQHHSMFVEPEYKASPEYQQFWQALNRGEAQTGEFKRLGKGGKEVWIQAAYTPILDENGNTIKVVKFATDITARKETLKEIARLIEAAKNGQLNERADIGNSRGDDKVLREGINQMLDTIVSPLNEASDVLSAAATKDLTKRVEGDYKGKFAEFKDNVNETIVSIETALAQVSDAVQQVSSASQQISASSQTLAEGSTEQAAGLEETSSSLEEMASMTKQNADNAQQANALATEARKAANNGTESMTRMSKAINDIQKSSDETAKIIKVIDEIAFQTNLLALNAAVEAARAGEAGKGFAVVAEEVRNLAMRSAEAAKNTANMIEESVKNSKNGVDIAGEVGKVLEEIVSGISKTSDLVSEIAAASSEQSQGIDQVNTAMAQMDKVTQQNAANAEESSSAAEELDSQAASLRDMVMEFALTNSANRSSDSFDTNQHKNVGGIHRSTAKQAQEFPNKKKGLDQSDKVFHKIAKGSDKKREPQPVAKQAVKKAIPFDEDEGNNTCEFEDFNS